VCNFLSPILCPFQFSWDRFKYGWSFAAVHYLPNAIVRVWVPVWKSCASSIGSCGQMSGYLHQSKQFGYSIFPFWQRILKLAPGDDLIMSNMYSLLNYIAATSKDIYESGSIYTHPFGSHGRPLHTLDSGLRELSEDERRMVGISTISSVTRLALEFKMEEVCGNYIILLFCCSPAFYRSPGLQFQCFCNGCLLQNQR